MSEPWSAPAVAPAAVAAPAAAAVAAAPAAPLALKWMVDEWVLCELQELLQQHMH